MLDTEEERTPCSPLEQVDGDHVTITVPDVEQKKTAE